jgi:hypothetical protein
VRVCPISRSIFTCIPTLSTYKYDRWQETAEIVEIEPNYGISYEASGYNCDSKQDVLISRTLLAIGQVSAEFNGKSVMDDDELNKEIPVRFVRLILVHDLA